MDRYLGLLSVCVYFLSLFGCALVAKQEWSQNYASIEGVRATNARMIDGNIRTFGETAFREGTQDTFGPAPTSQAIVMLPERKVIRRVVIHSDNLKKFTVYADKGSEDWEIIKEVNNVTSNPIDLSVNAPFPTDKIRVRVLGTTDDASLRRGQRRRNFWASGNRRAPAKIYEIELYGYQSAKVAGAEDAEDPKGQSEAELDQLLK
ncbi:hypothetical protein F4X33_18745 [Candidatus Poribacteria bacterium]|nr:hypothetical protein [Candidatus Poribacteria bacterium]